MLEMLIGFVTELRLVGIDLSMGDVLNAAEVIQTVPLNRRSYLYSGLAATLVKSPEQLPLFRAMFDVYFSGHFDDAQLRPEDIDVDDHGQELSATDPSLLVADASTLEEGETLELLSEEDLHELLLETLATGDPATMRVVAEVAVHMYARIPAATHLNVAYFVHRTWEGLRITDSIARIMAFLPTGPAEVGTRFEARLVRNEVMGRAERLRGLIADEVRSVLAQKFGVRVLLEGLRGSLLDELDLVHASDEELAAMRRALAPMARLFATRLKRANRAQSTGRLDFRRTIRRSLSSGGTLSEPVFRRKNPSRPEIFLLADVSGSVAAFASFIFSFMYALSRNIPNVRVAVFVNKIDEVTGILEDATSLDDAIHRLGRASADLHQGGDSDYGRALEEFERTIGATLDDKTRLLIVGDARTNHAEPRPELLDEIHRRVHRLYWLNPEPREYWGTGDSAMPQYTERCDAVFECRNLAQLKAFVAHAR